MNRWLLLVSVGFLALAVGCDEGGDDGGGGGKGGTAGTGGGSTGGGSAGKGGTGQAGSAGSPDSAGAAGQGGRISCEPPPPPSVGAGGEGGAAGGEGGGAGSAGEGAGTVEPLAIAGSYEDEFDGTYTITSSQWLVGSAVYHIAAYDNDERWMVARNDEGNMYDPCAWSRYDWVIVDEQLYYCTTVYNAETEEEARNAEAPDASDPAQGGCNAFPWSRLIPQ